MNSFMQMHVTVYRVMLYAVPEGTDASPNYLSRLSPRKGAHGKKWQWMDKAPTPVTPTGSLAESGKWIGHIFPRDATRSIGGGAQGAS